MACCKCVVPCMCPEMPEKQKAGLAYAVMQPLVYTNVQIRNWTAFEKLGVRYICSSEGILLHDFGLSRFPGRLQIPEFTSGALCLAPRPHSLQSGTSLQRAVQGRAVRTARHAVRNIREKDSRSAGTHVRVRRIRSRQGHSGHRG